MDTLTLSTKEAALCLAGLLALTYSVHAEPPDAVVDLINKLEEFLPNEEAQ